MYQILAGNRSGGKVVSVRRVADNADIPLDPSNKDYREFSAWNSAQSVPLDLSDRTPPVIRTARPLADIAAEVLYGMATGKLGRDLLLAQLTAFVLRGRTPAETGIDVDGTETNE